MNYKCLKIQEFSKEKYKIIPIRFEDRFNIMNWRNEQIYHLRQSKLLTEKDQNEYFTEIINPLFLNDKPTQILFSFIKNDICVGYGGLVHINWSDKHAEISFLMNTAHEALRFDEYWKEFLKLIELVAFEQLEFNKVYTYAFDHRPKLYQVLELNEFIKEATLKNQVFFQNKYIDVVIHSKQNIKPYLELATFNDAKDLFDWANDVNVRSNSINQNKIIWELHLEWLQKILDSEKNKLYILKKINQKIGQIRIEQKNQNWNISYSIANEFRNMGYGKEIIKLLMKKHSKFEFIAVVKSLNKASLSIFESLGFIKTGQKEDLIYFEYNTNKE